VPRHSELPARHRSIWVNWMVCILVKWTTTNKVNVSRPAPRPIAPLSQQVLFSLPAAPTSSFSWGTLIEAKETFGSAARLDPLFFTMSSLGRWGIYLHRSNFGLVPLYLCLMFMDGKCGTVLLLKSRSPFGVVR